MHFWPALACTLLLPPALAAAEARACPAIAFGPPHPTADRAAIAALRTLLREGALYESGGFVIESGGQFRASRPVTQRARNAVEYCVVLPRGAALAGLYHTHVSDGEFSPQDRRNSERAGVPSFVGTIRGADLFVYDPAGKQARAIDAKPPERGAAQRSAWVEAREQILSWLERLAGLIPSRPTAAPRAGSS